jgi:hypothetical protein
MIIFGIKTFFVILSVAAGLAAFLPYLRDIISRKTKPHVYTWLIWAITQGTATVGIYYGGGGWGGLELTIGTLFVIAIFLFSLKYGTKNITKADTIILIIVLIAILLWWQLKQPLLSVLMVSAIDVFGYMPTFRKSYQNPWSETLTSWILFAMSDIFSILALSSYNLLTVTYLISIATANIALFLFCILRRSFIDKKLD